MELAQVKSKLNTVVSYNNTAYILTGCTIRKDKKTKEIFYQAELADIKAHSVLVARLSEIKVPRRNELE